jgi:hypothetical protein
MEPNPTQDTAAAVGVAVVKRTKYLCSKTTQNKPLHTSLLCQKNNCSSRKPVRLKKQNQLISSISVWEVETKNKNIKQKSLIIKHDAQISSSHRSNHELCMACQRCPAVGQSRLSSALVGRSAKNIDGKFEHGNVQRTNPICLFFYPRSSLFTNMLSLNQ